MKTTVVGIIPSLATTKTRGMPGVRLSTNMTLSTQRELYALNTAFLVNCCIIVLTVAANDYVL